MATKTAGNTGSETPFKNPNRLGHTPFSIVLDPESKVICEWSKGLVERADLFAYEWRHHPRRNHLAGICPPNELLRNEAAMLSALRWIQCSVSCHS
jgi:hypothetical protein